MIPEIISSYEDFKIYTLNIEKASLFWIVEYNPLQLDLASDKYSLVYNEILHNPHNYKDRLNNGVYRIWTKTPYEKPW